MTTTKIIYAHGICAEAFQSRPQITKAVSGNPDNDNTWEGGGGGVGTEKRCSHNLQSVHLGERGIFERALFVIHVTGLLSGVFEC